MLPRILSLVAVAALALGASQAQAIHVDFADYRGAASGSGATIEVGGVSLSISAQPSPFDLRINGAGLGVKCTHGFFRCLTNQSGQIDSEWNESIVITFDDGPVSLKSVALRKLFRGETAVVGMERRERVVHGSRNGRANVSMAGVIVERLVFSARGWFSDFSVRGIEFDLIDGTTGGPRPAPHPAPEPSAALLFAAGLAAVGARVRRRG